MNYLSLYLVKYKLRQKNMATALFDELPFVNDACEGCGVSYLEYLGVGMMCVCDLLIEAGNCPGCLYLPENCKCIRVVRPTEIIDQNIHTENTTSE